MRVAYELHILHRRRDGLKARQERLISGIPSPRHLEGNIRRLRFGDDGSLRTCDFVGVDGFEDFSLLFLLFDSHDVGFPCGL